MRCVWGGFKIGFVVGTNGSDGVLDLIVVGFVCYVKCGKTNL